MLGTILSASSALALLALARYVFRKRKTAGDAALAVMALLLSALEVLERAALLSPTDPSLFLNLSLVVASLLPASSVVLGLSYARHAPLTSAGAFWKLLLGCTALFPLSAVLLPSGSFWGTGAYTGENRPVLYCVVTRAEIATLKAIVHEADPEAFMVIGVAHEALVTSEDILAKVRELSGA